jgi:hypothetical protein
MPAPVLKNTGNRRFSGAAIACLRGPVGKGRKARASGGTGSKKRIQEGGRPCLAGKADVAGDGFCAPGKLYESFHYAGLCPPLASPWATNGFESSRGVKSLRFVNKKGIAFPVSRAHSEVADNPRAGRP